jgi:hypothetical protein
MKPEKVPIKGPVGRDDEGGDSYMPEPQEHYESYGEHIGVTDIPPLDPFDLKAPEGDHTPNHTKAPKGSKIGWNFQHGRGNGGVGI